MEKITQTLNNGNTIHYKVVNGTAYHESTPDAVVNILEDARNSSRGTRLRFALGDTETGKDWNEIYDVNGYIGRSTGSVKIPLLISKTTSHGGSGILDNCIVKIERKRQGERGYTEVYQHSKYHKE